MSQTTHRTTHLSTRTRRRATALATAGTAAALVLLPAAAASAHVRVTPDTTAEGGYALLVFRVPTESDTASTTRVQVTLPTHHPFTHAAVQPVPGWTAEVAAAPLPEPVEVGGAAVTTAPATITWTADPGAGTAPGQFQQFPVSVGPLPEAGTTLLLPAEQTYSDGEVVSWDEPVPASGEEPEHPAPALTTTTAATTGAASTGHAGHAGGTTTAADTSPSSASVPSSPAWVVLTGLAPGLVGAVLGAAALVVALAGRRRSA